MHHARRVFEHLRRMAVAYAVLLVALVLTFLAYHYVRQDVEDAARYRFSETVLAARSAIENQMGSYVDAMFGARAHFYASDSVEMEAWGGYANGIDLAERYEGMRVLGYARRVEPEDKDEFVEELSQMFDGSGLTEPELRPEGERSVYFPMTFVEPFDDVNRRLVGYDVYSNPAYQAVMDRARDTGEAEATRKAYVLTEAPGGSKAELALRPGFVVYLPIYSEGEPTSTVAERRLAGEAQMTSAAPLAAAIGEATGLPIGESERPPDLSDFSQLDMAGQKWDVYFEALPRFREGGESQLPLFVLLSGLAVSFLLFGVTFMLVLNRLRTEKAGRDLEDANHELEATNRELEAFSYSVSHDLRAPLRSIDGFSQILLEDYSDEIDEEGKDYLGRVRAASQRMGRLIDDILGLSRVTRGVMSRERVNLSSLAGEVAEELREARPDRTVELTVQRGLEVWGDPTLLRVALVNLMGNAWKFTEKEREAKVAFGQDEELSHKGRVPVYYVSDNGAGFEMAYADKLFGAFQRLHGAEEFEGTGIGLATVQRVVHRHGGRIWAKGEVGQGATFFFTLRPGLKLDPAEMAKLAEKAEAR